MLAFAWACAEPARQAEVRHAPSTGQGPADDRGPDAEADTGADPPGDSGADTAADTDDDAGGPDGLACYPGADRAWEACVDTWAAGPGMGTDYAYAPPLDGSDQYLAPVRFVDIEAVDEALAVAPSFELGEFLQAYKGRWGVLQAHLVVAMQDLRDAIGEPLYVTSGYRSPSYNASVGGATYSRHMYGDAADMDATTYSVEELGDLCAERGASYVGLYEDGHTHCDWRDEPLDTAFYDAPGGPPGPAPAEDARVVPGVLGLEAPATGFDEGEPLRHWYAYDAAGAVIAEGYGRAWAPPPGAVGGRVVIGGRIERRW